MVGKATKKEPYKSLGIRMMPEAHKLMKQLAHVLELPVGQIYTEAAIDLLKRKSLSNATIKAAIKEVCAKSPDFREAFESGSQRISWKQASP